MSTSSSITGDPTRGSSTLPIAHEDVRGQYTRSDLTAPVCVAALIGIGQVISNISSIPQVVYPILIVAALLAASVVGATIWALWPRGLGSTPKLPGSWPHAESFKEALDLVDAYDEHAPEVILAGQIIALTPAIRRRWSATRVVLALFGATVATLLVALVVGLSS